MEATALVTLSLILFVSFRKNGVSASRDISNTVDHRPDRTPVVDKDGNEVKSGRYYYLEPYALVTAIVNYGETWQLALQTDAFGGLPVKFLSNDATIYESENLRISYNDQLSSEIIGGSPLWQVAFFSPPPVTLGGNETDRNSRFKIEKAGSDRVYKLVVTAILIPWNIEINNSTVPGAAFLERGSFGTVGKTFEFSLAPEDGKASASK